MVEIEKKIKDLLNKRELIPKEDIQQLFETRKQKIVSIFLDFIFKNNLEIYNRNKNNIKGIIRTKIYNEDNCKYDLIGQILEYKKYSKKYKNDLIMIIQLFSNKLFASIFFDYNFYFFINNKVLDIELLFNYKYSKECLTIVRQVSDLIYYDFSFLNKTVNLIYNYFQNIFRYSRRIMTYIFLEDIFRKKILKNLDKNIFYERLSVNENEDYDSDEFLKLLYKNDTEIKELFIYEKKSGINYGLTFQINKNKYYIKTFHNNSYKRKSSYEMIDLKFKFSSYSLTSKKELNKLIINIFEPLEYFILEELGYGPKVEIIINPYVNEGLYIVTKDIAENGNKFYLFKDIIEKIKSNLINIDDIIKNKNLVISLNEIIIISIILDIKDLNFGNFGFLEDEKTNDDNIKYNNIKIIDFIPSNNKINYNFSSYGTLISRQYNGIDLTNENIIGKIILSNDNNKNEILTEAFQKIKNKLNDRNIKDILEKCLIKYVNILETERGNNSDEIMLMNPIEFRKRKNYEFLGYQNIDSTKPYYYPNIKPELESYINFIINNFSELEKNLIK